MDKDYWENLAPQHAQEIFSVLQNDRNKIIRSEILRLASKEDCAADLGCAVGEWLPLLSAHFNQVLAVDISETYIQLAREANAEAGNIEYIRKDISHARSSLPSFHFGLCVNALMMPSPLKRKHFLKTACESLLPGGYLLLVVPSLESALLSEFMIREINRKNQVSPREKIRNPLRKFKHLKRGIVELDGVPYKHFLREEMEYLLRQSGLNPEKTQKVEYSWSTEMEEPPPELGPPFPWDWMFLAHKPG